MTIFSSNKGSLKQPLLSDFDKETKVLQKETKVAPKSFFPKLEISDRFKFNAISPINTNPEITKTLINEKQRQNKEQKESSIYFKSELFNFEGTLSESGFPAKGILTFPNGTKWDGEFTTTNNEIWLISGFCFDKNRNYVHGNYVNGLISGKATIVYMPKNNKHEEELVQIKGEFEYGKLIQGKVIYQNGSSYTSKCDDLGRFSGTGTYIHNSIEKELCYSEGYRVF